MGEFGALKQKGHLSGFWSITEIATSECETARQTVFFPTSIKVNFREVDLNARPPKEIVEILRLTPQSWDFGFDGNFEGCTS